MNRYSPLQINHLTTTNRGGNAVFGGLTQGTANLGVSDLSL